MEPGGSTGGVNENGDEERIDTISVSALLETSHRIPNLDYEILTELTRALTEDPEGAWKNCTGRCVLVDLPIIVMIIPEISHTCIWKGNSDGYFRRPTT